MTEKDPKGFSTVAEIDGCDLGDITKVLQYLRHIKACTLARISEGTKITSENVDKCLTVLAKMHLVWRDDSRSHTYFHPTLQKS